MKKFNEIREGTLRNMALINKMKKASPAAKKALEAPSRVDKNKNEATEAVSEGTWTLPKTPKQKMQLKKILSKPLKAKDASRALNKILGDDDLYDMFAEIAENDPNEDVRPAIRIYMRHSGIKEDAGPTKYEGYDVTEISLDHLKKQITGTGLKNTKKAYKFDKTKNDLAALKKRLSAKKPMTLATEAKGSYQLHHKTFTSAMQTAKSEAESRGYEVDMDDWDRKVASGPRKPSSGKTNTYSIKLSKNGKSSKQALQVQVYNMDNKAYELNTYVS